MVKPHLHYAIFLRFGIEVARKSHSVNEEIAYICDYEIAARN